MKSTDGGETWTLQGSADFTGACFYHISIDPTNGSIAFAASNQGLYRTNNGGIDWALQEGGLPKITSSIIACSDVIVHPADPDIAYCAFWGKGIYKTTNATKVKPTWTKLAGGLPSTNIRRIALAISPTSPKNVYALVASSSDGLRGFYTSDNDGKDWKSVGAATGIVSVFGAFTLNISVDISSPDVVYLSGVELYKAVRTFGKWSVTNIGNDIHPDNHALAGHPTDHLTIYAGNDGGIYKSTDGGKTWDDSINEGINITQFEFINQHPTSDAMVIGGTQDNGTEMYRNHPAFYHSADGDGGAAGVDASDPKNVIHTFYSASPRRSTEGGKFGSYSPISHGLVGNSLFYPPFTYDHSNSENLAFGTDLINLDDLQGLGGWKTTVALPGSQGRVSAVHYPNSKLIYAGTSSGNVYRLVKSGTSWTAEAIHDAPLPSRWIWDVSTLPGDTDTVIVVMAGYGTSHVWRGTNSGTSVYAWTDISGKAPKNVPDVPANLNYS